ncbi:hypothetical protein PAXINDRAFT_157368 [Paxillus involutus ATCC 200175]|uniref:Uncharacterized protein n=1 Tax=Paxillus involutus ATCC 200175 TaxID=664439 RepID=A0A0C9TVA8_PAXIN|nr:hypothetical protein PAXINDRAFT_157368 [Paxillus involutus ATCC 200175]
MLDAMELEDSDSKSMSESGGDIGDGGVMSNELKDLEEILSYDVMKFITSGVLVSQCSFDDGLVLYWRGNYFKSWPNPKYWANNIFGPPGPQGMGRMGNWGDLSEWVFRANLNGVDGRNLKFENF